MVDREHFRVLLLSVNDLESIVDTDYMQSDMEDEDQEVTASESEDEKAAKRHKTRYET